MNENILPNNTFFYLESYEHNSHRISFLCIYRSTEKKSLEQRQAALSIDIFLWQQQYIENLIALYRLVKTHR